MNDSDATKSIKMLTCVLIQSPRFLWAEARAFKYYETTYFLFCFAVSLANLAWGIARLCSKILILSSMVKGLFALQIFAD